MPLGGERPESLLAGMDPDRRGQLADMLASFTLAVTETLAAKTRRAVVRARKQAREPGSAPQSLVLAGGVAANSALRAAMADLAREQGLELVVPSPGLCTDNAAMAAFLGEKLIKAGLAHGPDLEAVPRGRAVPRDYRESPSTTALGTPPLPQAHLDRRQGDQ
jgi:N6-L-threonylcarbamoyladenine synthase